jgi:hypothetical protein
MPAIKQKKEFPKKLCESCGYLVQIQGMERHNLTKNHIKKYNLYKWNQFFMGNN